VVAAVHASVPIAPFIMEVKIEFKECFKADSVKDLLSIVWAVENYISRYGSVNLRYKARKVCAKRIVSSNSECVGYTVYGDAGRWGLYLCTNGVVVEWQKGEWGVYEDVLNCRDCGELPELPKDEGHLYSFIKRINQAALKALSPAALLA